MNTSPENLKLAKDLKKVAGDTYKNLLKDCNGDLASVSTVLSIVVAAFVSGLIPEARAGYMAIHNSAVAAFASEIDNGLKNEKGAA